jgi:hypothetical protein
MVLSREAAAGHSVKATLLPPLRGSRSFFIHFLRAYARSNVLPPLRG